MSNIKLLDCTLRDGGYVNDWHFGKSVIKGIMEKLVISHVDIIECGYLSQKKGGNPNDTQFSSLNELTEILPEKHADQEFAVMINYGEYNINDIPDAEANSPIIRVCFHKKFRYDALEYCSELIKKGYRVFVQAMAALNYSDVEYVDLIQRSNAINPHGFYIVDSFGVMETRDFQRLISLSEHNLDMNIILGYHSHNNLQQAYGNAKFFVEQNLQHQVLLDASVFGIGRGAGNLNEELFAAYLNKNYDASYNIDPMLDIMDDYLKPIFTEHFWGYSLPFYLSAQFNCHPNYANYFAEKNTLNNKSMRQLLASLPEDVKISYSADVAEHYYQEYQKRYVDDTLTLQIIKQEFSDRQILVLAPGKSLSIEEDKISSYISENNPIVVAVNVMPEKFSCDYLLCTNEKRIQRLVLPSSCKLIVTSNIMDEVKKRMVINYASYLMEDSLIVDNPTLMLFNLLITIGVKKVAVAGFDGYSANPQDNYFNENLSMGTSLGIKLKRNELIKKSVTDFSKILDIHFITKSLYQD